MTTATSSGNSAREEGGGGWGGGGGGGGDVRRGGPVYDRRLRLVAVAGEGTAQAHGKGSDVDSRLLTVVPWMQGGDRKARADSPIDRKYTV